MTNKVLPEKEALLDAMRVAQTSKDAADYLACRFKEVLTGAKMLDTYADVLQQVENFAKYISFKLLSNAQPWQGQYVEATNFNNMHYHMAQEAVEDLKTKQLGTHQEIVLDFAINEQAEFLRGYSSAGKALDKDALDAMDKSFSAWLVDNNFLTQDSVLYESDNQGRIIKNEAGANIRANPEQIKSLLLDSEKGFEAYLHAKGIKLSTQQHIYPSAQQEKRIKDELKDVVRAEAKTQPDSSAAAQSNIRSGGI